MMNEMRKLTRDELVKALRCCEDEDCMRCPVAYQPSSLCRGDVESHAADMLENHASDRNADRIRAMSDEELAEFIRSMVDGSNNHNVACYGCINYGTHHSDPANKGTYLYECDGCENEGIGLDVLMWLQQTAEEADHD